MNEKLLKVLEFTEIRERLRNYAVSSRAKSTISGLTPECNYDTAKYNLELTHQAYLVKYKYLVNPISEFDDLTEILNKARAGAVLRPGELLKVAALLRCARIAKTEISQLGDDVNGLKNVIATVTLDKNLETQISSSVASENELRDDASDKLRELRLKIHGSNAKLKEKLASYTRNNNVSKYLQDNIVTVRMGRFVLPVKSECRSMVPGLIHDQSSSGSTVFIEPFAVVELNNELKYLQMEERREIERILSVLSDYVARSYELINYTLIKCTELDIIFAKCSYSVSFNGTMPVLNNRGILNLKYARHPLIDPNKVIPVSVESGKEYDMLIVTGPNTGGKTVCLKTVGLCCLMAYCGIMVPCERESEVAVFDNIFCDLGDEQSIEQSLSTFSAHVVNLVQITNEVTPKSLVLLDELGSGTDPIEGAALSIGIIKYLELIGCKGIITTHFNELKEYALISPKLMNACMQFNEQTLKPTYKLMVGIPGVSNALQIAGTLGLNDYILTEAKNSISNEQIRFETVLRQAQYTKSQVELEKEELQIERNRLNTERADLEEKVKKLAEKQERIQNNAKAETNRIIANMTVKATELMNELKETLKAENEEALRKARTLLNRLEDIKHESDEQIAPSYSPFIASAAKVGQKVVVKSLGTEGILRSTTDKKGNYKVLVGNVELSVKQADLGLPVVAEKPKKGGRQITKPAAPIATEPTNSEIKLLGMTVSEAIEALEPLISTLPPGCILRIVHGKGTGALGKGVQAYLKTRREIDSYRYGRYGEGDTGVTIAIIK